MSALSRKRCVLIIYHRIQKKEQDAWRRARALKRGRVPLQIHERGDKGASWRDYLGKPPGGSLVSVHGKGISVFRLVHDTRSIIISARHFCLYIFQRKHGRIRRTSVSLQVFSFLFGDITSQGRKERREGGEVEGFGCSAQRFGFYATYLLPWKPF